MIELDIAYDQAIAEVLKLEADAEAQTKNLTQIEKRLCEIDYAMLQKIKKCAEDGSNITAMFVEQKKLQEEEDMEYNKFITFRQKKEETVAQLRQAYAKVIKLYHKKKATVKDQQIKPVDFSTSQLMSGTMVLKGKTDDMTTWINSSVWIPDSDIVLGGKQMLTPSRKETLLGSGNETEVYAGTCRGTEVAVKVLKGKLDEKALEEFRKECQVLKSILFNSNLLLFMGACIEEGKYKIVLEWAKNGSLYNAISIKKQQFSFNKKIEMLKEICTGMNWLHKNDPLVLHLNLKPSNILLSNSWNIKIADYGMAHSKRVATGPNACYVAPEYAKGDTATTKCDVYSFSIVAWYLLHEKEPSENLTPKGIPVLQQQSSQSMKVTYELLERCWNANPLLRPNFEDILNEKKWDKMTSEAATHGDAKVLSVWSNLGNPATVPWKDFAKSFATFLEIPKPNDPELTNRIEWICLHALFEVDSNNMVTRQKFERFLTFFGPVRTGPKEGPAWLDEVKNLLAQKWFHGPIDSKVAQQRMVAQNTNTPKKIGFNKDLGGLILRFSNSDPTFTLTYRKPKDTTFTNLRLTKDHFHDVASLISYVDTFTKKNKIEPSYYERKYQAIFDKHVGAPSNSAYSVADNAFATPDDKKKK